MLSKRPSLAVPSVLGLSRMISHSLASEGLVIIYNDSLVGSPDFNIYIADWVESSVKIANPICSVHDCVPSPGCFPGFFFPPGLLFPLNFCGIFRSLEIFKCLYRQAYDFVPLNFLLLFLYLEVLFLHESR